MSESRSTSIDNDIRPKVRVRKSSPVSWLFVLALVGASSGIFYGLQMRRLNLKNEPLLALTETDGTISSPPPLTVPPGLSDPAMLPDNNEFEVRQQELSPLGYARRVPFPQTFRPPTSPNLALQSNYVPTISPPAPIQEAQAGSAGMVYQPSSASASPSEKSDENSNGGVARTQSSRLRDPSATVPQGSVIQAVMETALDSTRAGFARAIVSRDVMSFDGSRVLIPRGSKLVGEYKADVSLGQKRALVQWRRLTLPDGGIIDVESPAADPLGRAGIKGRVNTHFFQRFSGAILQSVLDVGIRAATSEASNSTVIIGNPTLGQSATLSQQSTTIQPTLKVRQGVSVSVFVARDLVFL